MSMIATGRRYVGLLGALLRREEENRRHAPGESVLNLLEPIVMIVTLSFLFWFLGRRQVAPLGGPPILFYATGFFPLYFFIYISRRMRGPIDTPQRRFPIEQRLDHIFVHIILRIIDYAILGLLLFGGIYLLFTPEAAPADLVSLVLACLAIAGLGFFWGIVTLVLSRTGRLWTFFFPAFNRMLILFSGVFFLPDFLFPSTRYVMSFNPLLHAISLFRSGFYPSYPMLIFDGRYLAICCVVAVCLGIVIERVTRRYEAR